MTRRAHWGGLPLMLAPFGAWALGLGDIELRSALNQPLDADIELVSVTPEELADLRVALADPATFERYGLDRPAFLGRLSFGVGRDQLGRDVIRVTSLEPITEPFVTVLVEATWPRGRLLREYTVLLDPPVMLPAEAAVESVQPATTRLPEPTQPAAVIERPTPTPTPAPSPMPAPRPEPEAVAEPAPIAPVTSPRPAPEPAPAPAPAPAAVADVDVDDSPAPAPAGAYGPVQRGETLWGIAAQSRPAGITMNQMMVAIYAANPAAFSGNMNILREGATLVMPGAAALTARSSADATQEAIRQSNEWAGGAQQQARLRLLPPEVETATESVGTAESIADDPIEEPAEASFDPGVAGGEPVESERILSIEDEALSNLQEQLAEGPAITEVNDPIAADAPVGVDALVEPGVDLESEELLADVEAEGPAAAAEDGALDAVVEDAPAAVADDAAVEPPARAVSTQAVTTSSSPSLISTIFGWLTAPLLWMVVGLLALVGAGFVYLRSRQADAEDATGRWESLDDETDEDFEVREATERLRSHVRIDDQTIVVEEQHAQELPEPERTADELFEEPEDDAGEIEFEGVPDVELVDELSAPPAPNEVAETLDTVETVETVESLETDDEPFSPDATISSQTVINLDEADPIAEADFHMAYGLYDQAADLVSKALDGDPDNRKLRLKLLEVYFVWGNRESFLDAARSLHSAMGDSTDSDWDKVVIMGKQICPDEALFSESAGGIAESVDLDLATGDSPALDLAFEEEGDEGLDLDFGDGDDAASMTLELDSEDAEPSIDDTNLDLDIGIQTAAGLEAAFFQPGARPDDSAATLPNLDLDEAETQEAPTPEASDPDAPTIESPMLDDGVDGSVELPTIEQTGIQESPLLSSEATAEIDLDDLGLDMSDLSSLTDELSADSPESAAETETDVDSENSLLDAAAEDADVLSNAGVTQVLSAGDDPDDDALKGDDDAAAFVATEVLGPQDDSAATAEFPTADVDAAGGDDFGLDLDLDDLSAALDGGETVEQPSVAGLGASYGLNLDVSLDAGGNDDSTATEQMPPLDAQTLTEVGTKLDLARAYIDMGDPDGARSILSEVLDEGDSTQQEEAKGLIEALGA
jgi:pilus assembly protein FimV